MVPRNGLRWDEEMNNYEIRCIHDLPFVFATHHTGQKSDDHRVSISYLSPIFWSEWFRSWFCWKTEMSLLVKWCGSLLPSKTRSVQRPGTDGMIVEQKMWHDPFLAPVYLFFSSLFSSVYKALSGRRRVREWAVGDGYGDADIWSLIQIQTNQGRRTCHRHEGERKKEQY